MFRVNAGWPPKKRFGMGDLAVNNNRRDVMIQQFEDHPSWTKLCDCRYFGRPRMDGFNQFFLKCTKEGTHLYASGPDAPSSSLIAGE